MVVNPGCSENRACHEWFSALSRPQTHCRRLSLLSFERVPTEFLNALFAVEVASSRFLRHQAKGKTNRSFMLHRIKSVEDFATHSLVYKENENGNDGKADLIGEFRQRLPTF